MNEKEKFAPVLNQPVTASAEAGGCPPGVGNSDFFSRVDALSPTHAREEFDVAAPSAQVFPHNEILSFKNQKTEEHVEEEELKWYVMRSTYCREQKAKALLEADGIECYVPTREERTEKDGVVKQKTVSLVHNFIFVHSTKSVLDPWKHLHEDNAGLRYYIDKSTRKPMLISDKAMHDFILVTQSTDESLLYLDNPDVVLEHGQRVEVILGLFKGVQGYVLRIRKDRRVVVTLQGLVSVALATMPMSYFKKVEGTKG